MTITSFAKVLIDDDSSLPMYQKIKEHILEKIAKGEWKAHQKLPSENEISVAINVSRMTVNRAFKELTEEGYLFREKGAGTFVAEPFQLVPFFELIPISEEIAIEGNHFSTKVMTLAKVAPSQEIDDVNIDVLKGQSLFLSEICYSNNDLPIQYEKRYVVSQFAPQYLKEKFIEACTTTYLQKLSPILSQKHVLDAIIPDETLRNILQIGKGDACFKVIETLLVRNETISIAVQYYPASRYKFYSKI